MSVDLGPITASSLSPRSVLEHPEPRKGARWSESIAPGMSLLAEGAYKGRGPPNTGTLPGCRCMRGAAACGFLLNGLPRPSSPIAIGPVLRPWLGVGIIRISPGPVVARAPPIGPALVPVPGIVPPWHSEPSLRSCKQHSTVGRCTLNTINRPTP